jgi:hypothetical protein
MFMVGRGTWRISVEIYDSDDLCAEMITKDNAVSIHIKTINYSMHYDVFLNTCPQEGWLIGRWRRKKDLGEGHCQARLFRCEDGSLTLFGTWTEACTTQEWFVFLSPRA